MIDNFSIDLCYFKNHQKIRNKTNPFFTSQDIKIDQFYDSHFKSSIKKVIHNHTKSGLEILTALIAKSLVTYSFQGFQCLCYIFSVENALFRGKEQ